jgi:1-phosphatidylinositol-4-phosphate 5-kinase
LENLKNIQKGKGGRSGSSVFFTYDQRFVVKTVSNSEKLQLLRILPDYRKRISYSNSRLVRIIGLFKIKPENQDFIIMENIVSSQQDAIVFDIKGSNIDRFVHEELASDEAYGKVLKDLNLASSGLSLNLSDEDKKMIIDDLKRDFQVLAFHNIMDYSVLFAFYRKECRAITRYDVQGIDRVYSIGIIDFLQNFNIKKKTEKYLKKIIHREGQISTEVPELYKNRISSSICSIIDRDMKISLANFNPE